MKHRFTRSSRVLFLVAVLPACGGGDFTRTNGSDNRARGDAALDGLGSGGTTGDASMPGTGSSGGGVNSSGGSGSGGRQVGDGGSSSGGARSTGGAVGSGGDAGATSDAGAAGGAADGGSATGGTMNGGGTGSGGINGAGGNCPDPTTWYVDADQDGYGSKIAPTVKSCTQPPGHYTKIGGDCNDAERDVHPQLTQQEKRFFGSPYKTPAGADSFDYDCSGTETGDPSQPKAAASCTYLTVGACGGSGYAPGNRNGMAANAYCGSQTFQTCVKTAVAFCSATQSDVSTPYACN